MLSMRGGSDSAAIFQIWQCYSDMTSRLRTHCRFEASLSPLYMTPIHTEFGVVSYTCDLTERIVMLRGTARFGGYCDLHIYPLRASRDHPPSIWVKAPPNPVGMTSNPFEWRQNQQQLAYLYGHLLNLPYVNALICFPEPPRTERN